ncbi:MAG: cyclic-di-AMP receptor [Clostridia bacterium]|nr:cyclic-di-AMP receptor [Clostridia bacterium]
MKLIIAIVQDEDAQRLVSTLMEAHFGVTKLATTGGFLRAGNTTLISGVEDERLEKELEIIKRICHRHEQVTTTAPATIPSAGSMFAHYPVRVTVGGATVFVMDVEQFFKV